MILKNTQSVGFEVERNANKTLEEVQVLMDALTKLK